MSRKICNNQTFAISDFYCTCCGQKGISLIRKAGQYRKPGHLKKLYCVNCEKEWNHVEVRSFFNSYNYTDFQLEMKYNNFDENGERKLPYGVFKKKLTEEGVI